MIKNQKAAMFGLDARIALAIFAALSVITGAVLYSTIKNVKVTAFITDMQEYGKAWEQFYLDTGRNLPQGDDSNNAVWQYYVLQSKNLVEDPGYEGWKGPYLQSDSIISNYVTYNGQAVTMWMLTNETAWGASVADETAGLCTSGKSCYIWVSFTHITDFDFVKQLDEKIDKSDGGLAGQLKWIDKVTYYDVLLKYMPITNPND